VRGAGADLRAAQAEAENARLAIEQQAITAVREVETARTMVEAAEARVAATQSALRGTELEYQVGAQPQLALLDAQREAIEADAALAAAKGQLLVAAYRLRAITGMD
jgi:outer membrane protein